MRRRSSPSSTAAARRSKRPARSGRRPTPTSASCSTTRASTPCRSRRRTSITRCRRSGPVQAGKDVLVEKPVSYNMFEAQQIVAAARKYNRIVQDGTGAQRVAPRSEAEDQGRDHRRRLHGPRARLQVARHDRPRQGGTGARRRRLRSVDRPGAVEAVHPQPLPLQLALAVGLRQRRHRQPGRASDARGPVRARREVPDEDQLDGRALPVRR